MKLLRIAFVHHNSSSGGASNSLFQFLNVLKDREVDIHIITPNGPVVKLFAAITENIYVLEKGAPPTFFSAEGIRYIVPRSAMGYMKNRNVGLEIEGLLERINPDIVHLNDGGLIGIARIAKEKGYKVVMHARTALSKKAKIVNKLINRWLENYIDHLIPISESVSLLYKGNYNKTVVYNPYRVKQDYPLVRRNDEKFNCLFLANFLDYKGIEETIKACILLKSKSNINFYIAGSNVKDKSFFSTMKGKLVNATGLYKDYESWIDKQIQEHDLENVKLLGFVNNIENLFLTGHVMLAPFRLNSPPRNVFEAGMYGIPSILSLQDKLQDVVEDQINGLIIDERDPEALANAIMRMESDESFRQQLGQNAKRKFRLIHDPERSVHSMMEVYKSLAN